MRFATEGDIAHDFGLGGAVLGKLRLDLGGEPPGADDGTRRAAIPVRASGVAIMRASTMQAMTSAVQTR